MAIYGRRDGWEVRVYAGVDPVTGRQRRRLQGVRPAGSVPAPPGVRTVERRAGQGGRANVAGQVFTVSLAHVGRLLTVVIEEHQCRVLADGAPLKVVARKPAGLSSPASRRSSPMLQTAQQPNHLQ